MHVGNAMPLMVLYASEECRRNRLLGTSTFQHFDTLNRLVVDCTSAFFDKLVALNAEIDHFRSLYDLLYQLNSHAVNDVCCDLREIDQFFLGGM